MTERLIYFLCTMQIWIYCTVWCWLSDIKASFLLLWKWWWLYSEGCCCLWGGNVGQFAFFRGNICPVGPLTPERVKSNSVIRARKCIEMLHLKPPSRTQSCFPILDSCFLVINLAFEPHSIQSWQIRAKIIVELKVLFNNAECCSEGRSLTLKNSSHHLLKNVLFTATSIKMREKHYTYKGSEKNINNKNIWSMQHFRCLSL